MNSQTYEANPIVTVESITFTKRMRFAYVHFRRTRLPRAYADKYGTIACAPVVGCVRAPLREVLDKITVGDTIMLDVWRWRPCFYLMPDNASALV